MDKETRGIIEESLDVAIRKLDINDITGWILEEYPIRSIKDLALGYVLGSLSRYVHTVIDHQKWFKKFKERDREWKKEYESKHGKKWEDIKTKGDVKPIRAYLTKKDTIEIRDMLKRRIPDIAEFIDKELNR